MCRHFVPKTQNALGPPNEYLRVLISRSPNFLVVKTDPTTSHHPSDEDMHWWDNHLVTWLVPNNWKHKLFLSSFQCGEIITCLMLQRRMMTQILSKDSQPASTTDDNQSRQGLVVFVESPCMLGNVKNSWSKQQKLYNKTLDSKDVHLVVWLVPNQWTLDVIEMSENRPKKCLEGIQLHFKYNDKFIQRQMKY